MDIQRNILNISLLSIIIAVFAVACSTAEPTPVPKVCETVSENWQSTVINKSSVKSISAIAVVSSEIGYRARTKVHANRSTTLASASPWLPATDATTGNDWVNYIVAAKMENGTALWLSDDLNDPESTGHTIPITEFSNTVSKIGNKLYEANVYNYNKNDEAAVRNCLGS